MKLPETIAPMLAYSAAPFDSPRHLFEIKWDGSRCLMFLESGRIRLQNRRLQDITGRYPEFQDLPKSIPARNVILDGELVVLAGGRPVFSRLQQREHLVEPFKISLLARSLPATYIAFDLLFLDDESRLENPLRERKKLLRQVLPKSDQVIESGYIMEKGRIFFQQAVAQGFEGTMAKELSSPYLIGTRSKYWLKSKPRGRRCCTIIGYTTGQGHRTRSFGALLLATREGGAWIYRGRVGSGFSSLDLADIAAQLQKLKTEAPPFPLELRLPGVQWVRPHLHCEVSYQELTAKGHFRAPVFERLAP